MRWEDPDPADIVSLREQSDWQSLRERYDPNSYGRPLERCLEVARENGAKTVVIETRYIDLDYRSEYSSFFSKTFTGTPDTTHRLHFFKAELQLEEIAALPLGARRGYLGYLIVRPNSLGRVGRTMLVPPPLMRTSVQSTVVDTINFFGQELKVQGVPFAQQDTQFGRCAHVATWVCHYTAYLRGDVSRRPMAEFSLKADADFMEGRPFPSQGLTALQLSNLSRDFGLPPIVYEMGNIPSWGQKPPPPTHEKDDDPGTWDTRTVAVICRFLNSSYPVLVCTHEHVFVVIGYKRVSRRGKPWIDFIRHDDQRGPYLWVTDILNDIDPATGDAYSPWQMLLAPVPEKLWLVPEAAERTGRELLPSYDAVAGTNTFGKLLEAGELAFRTIATSSSKYKEAATKRGLDNNSVREIRLARLSRLVWVVEAIDRDERSKGNPCVLGEMVIDSTSSDVDPNVLLLRVPGALLVHQTDGTIRSPIKSTTKPVKSATKFQP